MPFPGSPTLWIVGLLAESSRYHLELTGGLSGPPERPGLGSSIRNWVPRSQVPADASDWLGFGHVTAAAKQAGTVHCLPVQLLSCKVDVALKVCVCGGVCGSHALEETQMSLGGRRC